MTLQSLTSISSELTINGEPLDLVYNGMQEEVYLNSTAPYVIASCGRRCGKTQGMAQYCMEVLTDTTKPHQILWVDIVYSTIQSYYERYFLPILKKLDSKYWNYNGQRKELTVVDNKLSFRSMDRPDLLLGLGYDLIVLNEAGVSLWEKPTLWTQILAPMTLDSDSCRVFFIGTPRGLVSKSGEDNLFYTMYKEGQSGNPQYKSFKYSSYDNPYLTAERIKKLEDEIPPMLRRQELYGDFLNLSELQIFNPEWWQYVKEFPEDKEFKIESIFISIDTAFSTKAINDESAATVWYKTRDSKYYCVDCWHDRLEYPALVEQIKLLAKKWEPHYLVIENKASGQSLVQTLKMDLTIPVYPFEPNSEKLNDNYDTDKISRAASITNIIEAGNVFLLKAEWNKYLVDQCTVFPLGSFDDIVDTISMALIHSRIREFNIKQLISQKVVYSPSKHGLSGYGNSNKDSLSHILQNY